MDPNYFCVHVFWAAFFSFFFFFGSAAIVDFVNCEQCIRALFTVPQITLFSHFFIKNGSHSTIYTFKNYFATVFSVSVFSFSKNKLNPNTPKMCFYNNALDKYAYAYILKAWCIFFIHFTIVISSFFLVPVFSHFSQFIFFFIIIFTIFTIHDTFQSTLLLSDTTNFTTYFL